MKVVCINDDFDLKHSMPCYHGEKPDNLCPKKGNIYTVIEVDEHPFYNSGFGYRMKELGKDFYDSESFRPVSDCGPAICEWIEETHFKELEYQEAIKQ